METVKLFRNMVGTLGKDGWAITVLIVSTCKHPVHFTTRGTKFTSVQHPYYLRIILMGMIVTD